MLAVFILPRPTTVTSGEPLPLSSTGQTIVSQLVPNMTFAQFAATGTVSSQGGMVIHTTGCREECYCPTGGGDAICERLKCDTAMCVNADMEPDMCCPLCTSGKAEFLFRKVTYSLVTVEFISY